MLCTIQFFSPLLCTRGWIVDEDHDDIDDELSIFCFAAWGLAMSSFWRMKSFPPWSELLEQRPLLSVVLHPLWRTFSSQSIQNESCYMHSFKVPGPQNFTLCSRGGWSSFITWRLYLREQRLSRKTRSKNTTSEMGCWGYYKDSNARVPEYSEDLLELLFFMKGGAGGKRFSVVLNLIL